MKIWVMFSFVGAALLFFSDLKTTSDNLYASMGQSHLVDETENPASAIIIPEGRIFRSEARNRAGSVSLEDYQPADPSPSSKASVKPGPIEHGAPLLPYMPNPAPPAGPPDNNG
ncbi:hypothetical protein MLD38_012966 [Melastoma candidum]|uniref:Uncharacterized protein n=1 Tax=Melastoma candidum TaxID=119954 RepID=A0ACB9RGI3_9MYRT|nr:hypothetical protein MLD38_012966 [Melastoma candidum]